MLVDLFTFLTAALTQSPGIAIGAALIWGILSIILSPCHIACIPLIVGFIDGQGNISTGRAFVLSLFFGLGILITIGMIGLITALVGRMMGDIGGYGSYFVAVVFFAVGLNLLGIMPLPFMEGGANPNYKRKGFLAAFILGLIFGIALGPCTFAYMATMLGVVFSIASTQLTLAMLILAAFAVGHCAVLIFAGTFTEVVQHYLHWTENSKGAVILKKICGVLVILGGVYLIALNWI
ncbi:MAG: cytochrome c biogenesis protein CcdA [Smithellaceae bacterium]|jgi:cytochrome c-type biogenesis protein|nr:cytochrome c biogenesis protein CcdA [Smithellaceae bacterium]HOS14782.1 cytochrome c biogenesis protein CcdA [Smithella sp.]MDD3258114.1 cytochrome c biogenesis protein CcdA [Smithellaceae bacterium]MDD3848621.1 cytochrome c biogenesis protein CcdA [Smithellaceae bacterium]HOC60305.1 cytochrome c biogenesis protein CcdA [Smithellaceae bacterium]